MREVRVPSVLPIYTAAAIWLIYATIFPLYKLWHLLVCGLLTYGGYRLLRRLFPGKIVKVQEPEKPADTGNPELDRLIGEGRAAMAQMRKCAGAVANPVLSGQLAELQRLSGQIFDAVERDPKKLGETRTFMSYYLPTTLKLLDTYENLVRQGVAGQNIDSTKKNIENVMETIVAAYRKRLDSLYETEAMDISADISVLETMLAREGLSDKYDIRKQ